MENTKSKVQTSLNIEKDFCIVLAIYIVLVVSFYFLAGDDIRFRESRGNITMYPAEAGPGELTAGVVVDQLFHAKIQRLESISVQWGTYYRSNYGIVTADLIRAENGELLMHGDFDAAAIGEGQILTIYAAEPIENAYEIPLIIRLTADSLTGSAAAPLINLSASEEGFALSFNGEIIPGILCFSASGTDYIWTGLHYWNLAAVFGILLAALLAVIRLRWRKGKRSYVINAIYALHKYRFLIRQLVSRDFKNKYKRSVLGMFWSFLNPLLLMMIQYFVFSTIFKSNIPNFAAYLIIGTVMFNFFSESCGMTLTSILGNAGLITKVYMPKYIYPLTRTMSSVVNLVISLIPMMIVCLITGVKLQKAALLSIFFFICLIIFCFGLGLLLSTSMVFFRDTQFLWGVLSMMWMYATPIFYPESIIPENLRNVLLFNPLYHFLKAVRLCILEGHSPEPLIYFRCLAIALGMLIVGGIIFKKNQDKFILYL